MKYPFFSIVIPTYNRASIILKTVSTILKQQFLNFEVIIVNDGSTDSTQELLQMNFEGNPKVKIIEQKNKERGAARNAGFKQSMGEYVVFFDSDDVMHENHLDILFENIPKYNYPLFIATKFDFVNEEGKRTTSDIQKLNQGFYDYTLFLNGNPLACNICVKKNNKNLFLFEEDRSYSIKEDWLFLIQNLREEKLIILDKVTISMLDHSQRSLRSDNKLIIQRTKLAFNWIKNKIKLSKGELKTLQSHVYYFCAIHGYLENNRMTALGNILKAIVSAGPKLKYLTLATKIFVGRKLINLIK